MSAVGKKTAIVSLGMACQSSWQIRRHIRLLRKLTGDKTLRESSMPFDWLICQPDSASRLMKDRASFPATADEIMYKAGRPWWARYNFFFWHDFTRRHVQIPIFDGFGKVREKYEYLWAKFQSLKSLERRIFVISNVQNNLETVAETSGTVDFHFTQLCLKDLISAADSMMECGSNEYIVVSYDDRIDHNVCVQNGTVALIGRDETEWTGSDAAWDSVFKQYFSSQRRVWLKKV